MTWLLGLFHRRQLEEQLEKEVRFHLDQAGRVRSRSQNRYKFNVRVGGEDLWNRLESKSCQTHSS